MRRDAGRGPPRKRERPPGVGNTATADEEVQAGQILHENRALQQLGDVIDRLIVGMIAEAEDADFTAWIAALWRAGPAVLARFLDLLAARGLRRSEVEAALVEILGSAS